MLQTCPPVWVTQDTQAWNVYETDIIYNWNLQLPSCKMAGREIKASVN